MARKSKETTKTTIAEVSTLLERIREGSLSESDLMVLERVVAIFLSLLMKIEEKRPSIEQLRILIFGKGAKSSETKEQSESEQAQAESNQGEQATVSEPKPKRKGHGRKAANASTGAKIVDCQEADLQIGAPCLDKLCKGHLQQFYRHKTSFIRYEGQPPIGAIRYDQELFRCSACTTLYTAKLPDGVPAEKFAPSADASIVIAKYGSGTPFNRLSQWQSQYGVPISASVMWERVLSVANVLLPLFLYMRLVAAQSSLIFYDDTSVKIIHCQPHKEKERAGIRTTVIIAEQEGHRLALYASGRNHAGDNVKELMKNRPKGLDTLIRMCDALQVNLVEIKNSVLSLCLQHGRRNFVELVKSHQEECQGVIDAIHQVYVNEARTKGLTDEERLLYHQLYSGPIMEKLKEWLEYKLDHNIVEPSSVVGKAYAYMLTHWNELTQFLQIKNAPIDNNPAERGLKIVQLHRKNAGYFRNDLGAFVGDLCMTILESAKLAGIDAFPYLLDLIRNERAVRANPADWLPWVYAQRIADKAAITKPAA